jgi:hypothetical protein
MSSRASLTHTHTHTQASGVTVEEWPRDIARPDVGHQLIPYVLDRVRLELYGRFAAGMYAAKGGWVVGGREGGRVVGGWEAS